MVMIVMFVIWVFELEDITFGTFVFVSSLLIIYRYLANI